MLLVIGRVKCAEENREIEVVSERPEVAIHEIAGTSDFPGQA